MDVWEGFLRFRLIFPGRGFEGSGNDFDELNQDSFRVGDVFHFDGKWTERQVKICQVSRTLFPFCIEVDIYARC